MIYQYFSWSLLKRSQKYSLLFNYKSVRLNFWMCSLNPSSWAFLNCTLEQKTSHGVCSRWTRFLLSLKKKKRKKKIKNPWKPFSSYTSNNMRNTSERGLFRWTTRKATLYISVSGLLPCLVTWVEIMQSRWEKSYRSIFGMSQKEEGFFWEGW